MDNRGMTLIEVTVALVLFVFVFAILAYGINSAIKVMGKSVNIKNASQLSSSKIENNSIANPNAVTVAINNKNVNGNIYTATASSGGGGLESTVDYKVFIANPAQTTKTIPSVKLPAIDGTDAYLAGYGEVTYKNGTYSFTTNRQFIQTNGQFEEGTYLEIKDRLNGYVFGKAITNTTVNVSGIVSSNGTSGTIQYIRAVFFNNNIPFNFLSSGDNNNGSATYNVDFASIGEAATNTIYANNTQHLIFGSKTLIYLWGDITVKDKSENTAPNTLKKGYYLVPDGSSLDLVQAAYDNTQYNALTNAQVTSRDSITAILTGLGLTYY